MTENELAKIVVNSAIKVHRTLGPGLLESVNEGALFHELSKEGLEVCRQVVIPVVYDGIELESGFRADLIVGGKLIVEIKSLEAVPPVAYKVLLTYLRLSHLRLGLLINFGLEFLKDGITRMANNLPN